MTRNYSILPLLGSLLLLAACSSDPVADDRQRLPLTLVPSTSTYEDVLPEEKPEDVLPEETRSGLATRADYEHLPAGYMPYAVQYATAPKNSTIGIWMTPDNTTSTGSLIYKSGSDWKSSLLIFRLAKGIGPFDLAPFAGAVTVSRPDLPRKTRGGSLRRLHPDRVDMLDGPGFRLTGISRHRQE